MTRVPRRVVYFSDSEGFGGAEQVLLQLLTGLDPREWTPVLFHHGATGLAPLVERARAIGVQDRVVPRMSTARDVGGLRRFVGALRAEAPDVFHAQLTWPLSCKYGLLAARLARVPAVVATAHSRYQIAPVLARQPRVIARCVDRYLAVSQGVARQLREDFRIPARKVSLVRNGIVPPGVPPPQARAALRAQLTAGADRPIVLTVARLDLRKGLQYLLDAVRQVPQAMLVLAGDGEDRSTLEAQARDLQVADRVVFLGHRTDVPALLAAADVFVLPSLTEGLPISLLEAMAAGTPVVGTAIEGIDELIVAGETGVLVPPADANGLAAGILAVLRDPAGAHVRATAARAFVDREFTVERARTQVLEVYRELLVAKGRMDP